MAKLRFIANRETFFAALLLRFGKAPDRAFVDRYPESKWGITNRSLSRAEEATNYELPIVRFLRETYAAPQQVFNEFLRWQAREGLIDLSIRKSTGVRNDGKRDFRIDGGT